MERREVTDEQAFKILEVLTHNIGKKIEKHGRGAYVSRHECYGIIEEERHELLLALHANNATEFAQEAIDLAVACIWSVASMLSVAPVKQETAEESELEIPDENGDEESPAEAARRLMIERAAQSNIIIAK